MALLAAACSSSASSAPVDHGDHPGDRDGPAARRVDGTGLPPIRHVFVIVLENEGYDETFGDPTADPYLATTLPSAGAQLSEYHGIGTSPTTTTSP